MVTVGGIIIKHLAIIKENTLLKTLPKEIILNNLKTGRFIVKSYEKDNMLHFEGEKCKKIEVILSGKVVVERINSAGDILSISQFETNDILGGNILFSQTPYYPLTVSTLSNTTILEIDIETLSMLLTNNTKFMLTYLQFVSDHSNLLGNKIKNYVNKSIRSSVLTYLAYESKKQESNYVKLTVSKTKLAEKFGVQRTSLSRELAKMKKEQIIDFDAVSITILKDINGIEK